MSSRARCAATSDVSRAAMVAVSLHSFLLALCFTGGVFAALFSLSVGALCFALSDLLQLATRWDF